MRLVQFRLWQRRAAIATGAVLLGLAALAFARLADWAQAGFAATLVAAPLAPLAAVPAGYAAIVWVTRRWAPAAGGSGIPQVIAQAHNPDAVALKPLTSLHTAAIKFVLTLAALLVGGSVGREGPTVQISAALMCAVHRLFRVKVGPGIIIAGGAAGVSAAFNTPLAGVAFAIEELASAYEQRLALLVMGAVIAGDYLYFGAMHAVPTLRGVLLICPLAGVAGGLCGGFFSRLMLAFVRSRRPILVRLRTNPILWAGACGLGVAVIGVTSHGNTWGTGYLTARTLVEGGPEAAWFGPQKFAATLLTALSGIPGGIFAPSLATGAGLGSILAAFFPGQPSGAVVTIGMIAYFVGVVRAPLTAVLIVAEMTDSRAMILPLFATALVADGASALVCSERLYHGLSRAFREPSPPAP
jgi:H+/Cl- antiporter ClcA